MTFFFDFKIVKKKRKQNQSDFLETVKSGCTPRSHNGFIPWLRVGYQEFISWLRVWYQEYYPCVKVPNQVYEQKGNHVKK